MDAAERRPDGIFHGNLEDWDNSMSSKCVYGITEAREMTFKGRL
jgi:hypothetical protein